MEIRLERQEDYFEVENMVRNAFWNIYRPGAFEHIIVHNLRNHPSFIRNLAYVIEKDDKIIGHINYSEGVMRYENGDFEKAVVLGPIAIDEDYQNQGYGSELIEFTLSTAKEMDIPYVFVIGDENYYSRFGFEPASKYGIHLEGTDASEECPFFMINVFDESKLKAGTFQNPDVFDVDEKEADEFDKQFEYKEKLIMEGQLGV